MLGRIDQTLGQAWKPRPASEAGPLVALLFAPLAFALNVLSALRVHLVLLLADIVHFFQGSAKSREQNPFLHNNFAPVQSEVHEQKLPVEGSMPRALDGVFARTGPNPYFMPRGNYHWFDGDGMLHACRIKNGTVSYCNKFMSTFKLAQEKAAGAPVFGKFGDLKGIGGMVHIYLRQLRDLLGIVNKEHGTGTANTALVYHANKFMSLHEGDLPYAVRVLCNGLIESLGRVEFDGKVDHPFTAHPKLDAATGELFFIGYEMDPKHPRLWYAALSPAGELMFDQSIALPHAVMHHDFAITHSHALIVDHCLEFNGKAMLTEGSLPFKFNPSRNARIGVLPKRPQDNTAKGANVRWFELDQPFVYFHTCNAWEEGDVIHLFLCIFEQFDMEGFTKPASTHSLPAGSPQLAEIRLNLRTGQSELRKLQPGVYGDFPRVRQDLIGCPSRFAYMPLLEDCGKPIFRGLGKFDLQSKASGESLVARLSLGSNHGGGETFFVPSHPDPSQCSGEDDGYLVTFVHDEAESSRGTSWLVVYDAKTMSGKPVARVRLPQRVPYGFHCHHMSEREFQEHLKLPAQTKFVQPK